MYRNIVEQLAMYAFRNNVKSFMRLKALKYREMYNLYPQLPSHYVYTACQDASTRAQATDSGDCTKCLLGYSPRAIAYTDEPKTFMDYVKQTDRWFSIRDVVKSNAKNVKRGLKITAVWSFAEATMPFIFLAPLSYLLYIGAYLNILISCYLTSRSY